MSFLGATVQPRVSKAPFSSRDMGEVDSLYPPSRFLDSCLELLFPSSPSPGCREGPLVRLLLSLSDPGSFLLPGLLAVLSTLPCPLFSNPGNLLLIKKGCRWGIRTRKDPMCFTGTRVVCTGQAVQTFAPWPSPPVLLSLPDGCFLIPPLGAPS